MYSWRSFRLKRFFGLDLNTNVIDVVDGKSLDLENVYQNERGTVQKRRGGAVMFDSEEAGEVPINEIGAATLGGQKYYFKFSGGRFHYSTDVIGAITTIAPAPAIASDRPIYWAVLDDLLFFVDGLNNLRFFDGTQIQDSEIYERPIVSPSGGSGTGFDYTYTVDNGLGESPAALVSLNNIGSAQAVTIQGNTGPQTLVAGDVVKVYSKATTVAAAYKLVAEYIWTAADVTAGSAAIATTAISDAAPQLYSELGVALNKSAEEALEGITVHYGRLVAWKGSRVHVAKNSNPHSWPDDSAQKEAFRYGIWAGDGTQIQRCISFRESLFAMKPGNVAVFGGFGPDDTGNGAFAFRRLETQGDGCVGGKSAVVVGDEDNTYLIWLSKNGFRATDGYKTWDIGEDIRPATEGLSEAVLSSAHAINLRREGHYLCFLGGVTKTGWLLDIRKDNKILSGWWKQSGLNASASFYDEDRWMIGTDAGVCQVERVALISSDFSDVKQEYLDPSAVNDGADKLTVAQEYQTGDRVVMRSSGVPPGGLTANVTYYIIRLSATEVSLALTLSDAQNNIPIDLTDQGSGVHSIVGAKAIAAYYTTNWINFGTASRVKKLGKPCFIFNAQAESVSFTIDAAYDWLSQFFYPKTTSIQSDQEWGDGAWGEFVWGEGGVATPRNTGLPRRKCRSIRYRFANAMIDQDFNLQGLEQQYAILRNRGNFAA